MKLTFSHLLGLGAGMLFSLICTRLHAQWEVLGGPRHYQVSGFTRWGDELFAATREGIFSHPVTGGNWQAVAESPEPFYPGPFFKIDNALFSASVSGLYKSNDGDTWTDISPQPGKYIYYRAVDDLIFGVERFSDGRIYRSEDGGISWDTVILSGNFSQLYFLGKVNNKLYAWITASGQTRVFQSTDQGNSWTDMGLLPSASTARLESAIQAGNSIFVPGTPLNPGVYRYDNGGLTSFFSNVGLPAAWGPDAPRLSEYNGAVFMKAQVQFVPTYYRSTNNGSSWQLCAQDLYANSDMFSAHNALYLLANGNVLYRSNDLGVNWSAVNIAALPDFRPSYLYDNNDGAIALYGEGGAYVSADDGTNWSLDRDGIDSYELAVFQLARQSNFLYAATTAGLIRSADQGANWQLSHQGIPQLPACLYRNHILAEPGLTLFATPFGVFRSTDNGDAWTETFFSGFHESPYLMIRHGGSVYVLTLATNRIFRSDNNAQSWYWVCDMPTAPYSFFLSDGSQLVCGGGNKYYTSTSGGNSWDVHSYSGLTNFYGWNMVQSNGRYYVRGSNNGPPYVGISTDLSSWAASPMDTVAVFPFYEMYVKDSLVLASVYPNGLYVSTSYGESWLKIESPSLPAAHFNTFEMDDTYLYVGTSFYGVYRTPASVWEWLKSVQQSPEALNAVVSPNPAHSKVSVEYELSGEAVVEVRLYDNAGQKASLLLSGRRGAGRQKEDIFLPPGLPSGLYWLSLHAGRASKAWAIFVR